MSAKTTMTKLILMAFIMTIVFQPVYATEWQQIKHYQIKDGLVKDTETNLIWKRCDEGQEWNGQTCANEHNNTLIFTFNDAMNLKSNYAGYSDWRLPTREELKTLVYCSSGEPNLSNNNGGICKTSPTLPSIDREIFPNANVWRYWSSSLVDNNNHVWTIDFRNGTDSIVYKYDANFVRLVRSGQ